MTALPVAGAAQVRRYAVSLAKRHPRALGLSLALYAAAALAGLVAPRLLGALVEAVEKGTTAGYVDRIALALAGAVLLQTALTKWSRTISLVLAEEVFADLREDFLERVVALPLSTVERAGSGDLLSRTTSDVDTLAKTVRYAVPEVLVATVTSVLTIAAAFLVSPTVASAMLLSAPVLFFSTRWYLRRAPDGYLRERAAYAVVTAGIAETAEGSRTVESLRRQDVRRRRGDDDIRYAYGTELYTLRLRTIWFPLVDLSFVLPLVSVVLLGGWLYTRGDASLGEVTAVALYVQLLLDPLDRLLSWLDELQVGASSLARLIGIAEVPDDRSPSGQSPEGEDLTADDVRFSYRDGHDVLHGLDLAVRPGERLAVVGPSGAGKSTLGRLLAGVHGPRSGTVTLGGVPMLDLPLEQLRTEVSLVTQEHHVFVGTLRENLLLAREDATDEQVRAALDAVDWTYDVDLDAAVGAGGLTLSPAQAQQVALARLVLADPHTLVLDEATSLLDPRAARHLERSLAAVVTGRTVVAIAHRLHTASDADRVAVVEGGRVTELGSHDELLALGGSYAALWASWQSS
ncbi:MAG: transporter related protein [Frankiales bacterium]|nr:transporter related protein [Frankiales bacterium]